MSQGCKNAGKYAYFPCHWYLPAFMANMVANMAYMVNSMDSYQIAALQSMQLALVLLSCSTTAKKFQIGSFCFTMMTSSCSLL